MAFRGPKNDATNENEAAQSGTTVATKDKAPATFEEAMQLGVAVPEHSGPELIKDKRRLIGVPFVILKTSFNEGKNGPFVTLEIMTKGNEHIVINDGSTGIASQMVDLYEIHKDQPIVIQKGLRVSDYFFNTQTDEKSRKPQAGPGWQEASTFYLDY